MVKVMDLSLEGRTFESRRGNFFGHLTGSVNVSFSSFPVVCPFTITPHWKQSKHRSLKNCFSAKPQFSSSYWGKQCFRSPGLSTYRFCVDWKRFKHVRFFFWAWKIVFLQSPISSHKTIRGHATKKMNRKGELPTSHISSNLRIWQSYSRAPRILKVLCVWYTWK